MKYKTVHYFEGYKYELVKFEGIYFSVALIIGFEILVNELNP